MKKVLVYLVKSILAGVAIGLGGTIFLSVDNKIVGSLLFGIGLFVVVTQSLNLYTGKVGYIVNNDLKYLIEVLVTIVGNFIGTFFVGFVLRFTRIYESISTKAQNICSIKISDSVISILILSFFCGILMYIAVNGYKVIKDNIGKYVGVFLGVMVFILCGFEHSIANMYYFSVADMWNLTSFGYLIIMILGNALGCVFIPLMEKCKKLLEN